MVKILLSEWKTGIILSPDFCCFQRKGKEELPYINFNSRAEALQYIDKIKMINDSIEFILWNENDDSPELIR